ncbi:hypothetical protein [Streptomyces drozdowiczii]|uniref:Uncharacterized protein n=1 Tax=Streptomyces drozdowiczii TaxID=202862 RepID=A0ABY6PT59_9ACTN|nr:hypothetical protein [Streptomyces drozdowiczii]MCX0245411.1 hypothetical protein [Streptomyces drozdowiczii]UZK54946.1 hypothetical protein NEH16_13095 [Streptomyces drozdowiczii]
MGNSGEIENAATGRDVDRVALDAALLEALNPVAEALQARATGLPPDRMWAAEPVEVSLSVLAAWKVVDEEVKRLTAIAARTAGSYGANYERLGAAWGITRQGARKKWPDAVGKRREASKLELFGGRAELSWEEVPGGWCWSGLGADGTHSAADGTGGFPTKEEAAAHAGAFLKEHAE